LETTEQEAGQGLTRQAVEQGVDLVLAAGGDGTVMACVTGLATSGVPLAVLPAGTGNLLALNLDLPSDLDDAVDVGLHGDRRHLDVGAFDGGAGRFVMWEDNVATDEVIEQRLGEDPEDEEVKERLEREHSELLEELRALIPGAEVLFGFLLAIRFTSEFKELTAVQRYVYYGTLVSTAVALVLLLAPPPITACASAKATRT
jgi:predicted polyphosphate/ATP-dependent NAD kinase